MLLNVQKSNISEKLPDYQKITISAEYLESNYAKICPPNISWFQRIVSAAKDQINLESAAIFDKQFFAKRTDFNVDYTTNLLKCNMPRVPEESVSQRATKRRRLCTTERNAIPEFLAMIRCPSAVSRNVDPIIFLPTASAPPPMRSCWPSPPQGDAAFINAPITASCGWPTSPNVPAFAALQQPFLGGLTSPPHLEYPGPSQRLLLPPPRFPPRLPHQHPSSGFCGNAPTLAALRIDWNRLTEFHHDCPQGSGQVDSLPTLSPHESVSCRR